MVDRIPPHNEEAERSALGAAMRSKDALYDVLEAVHADDFYNENHREIYHAIQDLNAENTAVDMLTVCDMLTRRQSLEMVGGRAYIAALAGEAPSTVNAGEYARIVAEKASQRQLIDAAEEILEKGYEGREEFRDILNFAEGRIFQIGQNRQRNDYTPIREILLRNMDSIDEAAKNQGHVVGLATGFKALDEKTTGLHRSDLIIVAARPAMGKSAFALNIAQYAAVHEQASVLVFSLEMSKEQLGQRLLAMQAHVEIQKLKTGELDHRDWDRLQMAMDELHTTKLFIDDTPGISLMEMRNKCRRLKAESGLDLVVIDYLQLMQYDQKTESRQQEITAISRSLKLLAREMDCPVVVLSQLSRAPEARQDHRPILSDLRESGSIEQDADIVIFLYRDDYYHPDNTDKHGICEVNIAKHRSGPTDKIELTFVERYTKFSDKAM